MLDDFGEAADPARDDGRPARHRLEDGEPQKLGDRDVAAVARPVHGREDEHPGLPIERGEVAVGHGAEKLDSPASGEALEEGRVVALGWTRIVSGRAGDAELGVVRKGGDEPIDSFVRRDAADEENAAADEIAIREEALRVGAAVDDSRPRGGGSQLGRRIGRHGEEAVEKAREQASPRASLEPVVRDGGPETARSRKGGDHATRRGAHMVCVDDVRAGERAREAERDWVGRMAAEEREWAKDADAKTAALAPGARRSAEADELAVDVGNERAGEFERVSLAPAEQARRAEERGSDVDDEHLLLRLLTLGDPRRLSGGYLYHLRMADAAPGHGARIDFVSFPERPFPLAAVHGRALLRRARAGGAAALLLDSIAAAFAAPALALGGFDLPVVGVLHQPPGGIDYGALRTAAQRPLDRLALRRADVLIAASDHLAEQLAATGLPDARIRVVPPGRDVAPVPAEPPGDLRRGRRAAFLCVANWLERKGTLELLDAFARLPEDAATLHLAGDEQADARYATRVRLRLGERDLAGRVVVHGRLPQEAVAALYEASDAFVLPASREPYGTVWGEAMAFGLPVVGWRAGNLPYLADDGREALLVEPGDLRGLTEALGRLAVDVELRARLGEAARTRAAARPTWEESAALFYATVRNAVATHSPADAGK